MFGNLGEMAGLLKKFGEIQKNMKKMQEEMSALELTGRSSCGRVELVIGGDMKVKGVRIDGDSSSGLEVAVKEAVEAALSQVKAEGAKRLSAATGGLSIPGLF